MRPVFGPAQQTLGHPATTRFLERLDEEERAEMRRLDALNAAVGRHVHDMLDRQEADRASRKVAG